MLNFQMMGTGQKTNNSSICTLTKSPHHLVYDFYTLLALTDAKGYAMMQFSWMLLRLYDRGSFWDKSCKIKMVNVQGSI